MIIREARMLANITQESLAKKANVSRTMISKIENGNAKPSVSTAIKLGEILGIDWPKIFEEERENNSRKK